MPKNNSIDEKIHKYFKKVLNNKKQKKTLFDTYCYSRIQKIEFKIKCPIEASKYMKDIFKIHDSNPEMDINIIADDYLKVKLKC